MAAAPSLRKRSAVRMGAPGAGGAMKGVGAAIRARAGEGDTVIFSAEPVGSRAFRPVVRGVSAGLVGRAGGVGGGAAWAPPAWRRLVCSDRRGGFFERCEHGALAVHLGAQLGWKEWSGKPSILDEEQPYVLVAPRVDIFWFAHRTLIRVIVRSHRGMASRAHRFPGNPFCGIRPWQDTKNRQASRGHARLLARRRGAHGSLPARAADMTERAIAQGCPKPDPRHARIRSLFSAHQSMRGRPALARPPRGVNRAAPRP
jgi:hypothetical protein